MEQHQPSLTVVLGIPGSGKSTHSKTLVPTEGFNVVRINLDDIRLMFGTAFDESLEPDVWWLAINAADYLLSTKRTVIIDESVTDPKYMRRLKHLAHRHGVPLNGLVIESPSYLCWKKRESTHFPREAFEKKFAEWARHKETIVALCDSVEYRQGNKEMLEEICRKSMTENETK